MAARPHRVQFVHRWSYECPEDVVLDFDFTISRASLWADGHRWRSAADPNFYADLERRRLRYCSPERDEDRAGSFHRLLRFYGRGYRASLESLSKVLARLGEGRARDLSEEARLLDLLIEADTSSDSGQSTYAAVRD